MAQTKDRKDLSPVADDTVEVDISDEQVEQLNGLHKEGEFILLACELYESRKLLPFYTKRRPVLKNIPNFWPTAINRHPTLEMYSTHASDKDALTYLEDLWIAKNDAEPRACKIEFHFKQNPYFSDAVLVKDYEYVSSAGGGDTSVDEFGLTSAQRDFNEERDIKIRPCTIDWKSDDKNLVKQYPRKVSSEEDDLTVQDPGSFFNWFVEADDEMPRSVVIELFENAIDLFFGRALGDDEDITDSDSENEDVGDEEVDLEQPKRKRARNAN